MASSRLGRGRNLVGALFVCGLLLGSAGCATNGASGGFGSTEGANRVDAATATERDDIYEVINFWAMEPWLTESGRIVGFRVSTRFISSFDDKGAFVPGRIFIWLYGFGTNVDGQVERKLLHVWDMDRDEAMGWRITKRTRTGLAYWFLMRWPDELKLEGRRIEVEIGYERIRDKRLIMSGATTKDVRISATPQTTRTIITTQPARPN